MASDCTCARSCRSAGSSRTWSASGALTCCCESATSRNSSRCASATSTVASPCCSPASVAVGPDDPRPSYRDLDRFRNRISSQAWTFRDPPGRSAGTCCLGSRIFPLAPAAVAARSEAAARCSFGTCFGAAAWGISRAGMASLGILCALGVA